jgi:hypothetical protein
VADDAKLHQLTPIIKRQARRRLRGARGSLHGHCSEKQARCDRETECIEDEWRKIRERRFDDGEVAAPDDDHQEQ